VPRRPLPPLLAALACAVGLTVTGVLAKLVPVTAQGDAHTLEGFVALRGPRLDPVLSRIAHLADPAPYALTALLLALVALARGRRRVAVAVLVVFFATGYTTEQLKTLVASPRVHEWFGGSWIGAASWPSGHATAAMTMALCAVLVSPPRLRPTVAAVGGAFAIAVAYAILTLAWHFPSDVLGGYLVAGTYVGLAIAALARLEQVRPVWARAEAASRPVDALPAMAIALAVAGAAAGLAVTRPHQLVGLASEHTTFVAGAAIIAGLAVLLAAALALGGRGGSDPRTPAGG
jgi:membrane-associated phospholipid phosphatase